MQERTELEENITKHISLNQMQTHDIAPGKNHDQNGRLVLPNSIKRAKEKVKDKEQVKEEVGRVLNVKEIKKRLKEFEQKTL